MPPPLEPQGRRPARPKIPPPFQPLLPFLPFAPPPVPAPCVPAERACNPQASLCGTVQAAVPNWKESPPRADFPSDRGVFRSGRGAIPVLPVPSPTRFPPFPYCSGARTGFRHHTHKRCRRSCPPRNCVPSRRARPRARPSCIRIRGRRRLRQRQSRRCFARRTVRQPRPMRTIPRPWLRRAPRCR